MPRMRRNPHRSEVGPAVDKYREFHRFDPKDIGPFEPDFSIPDEVVCVGRSLEVLYRSGKVDPETMRKPRRPLSYIHDHEAGVFTHLPAWLLPVPNDDVELVEVPYWIREAPALTLLGQCLGFAYQPEDGDRVDAEGTRPLPELYCTPDGRALLVVQDKREVLALVWGGTLGVEARGIVG